MLEWSPKSPFRPFCSEKCRLFDLGDWANENHTIAGEDGEAHWLQSENIPNGTSDPHH